MYKKQSTYYKIEDSAICNFLSLKNSLDVKIKLIKILILIKNKILESSTKFTSSFFSSF